MTRRNLIVQLLGGLGNQMFQYGAGICLSQKHGVGLLVDTSILLDHTPGLHEVNRQYGLDIFQLDVRTASDAERWKFNSHGLPLPVKVLHRLMSPITSGQTYREQSFRFDDYLLSRVRAPRYISGNWQSYQYIEPVATQLRSDFRFREPIPESSASLATAIRQANSVCLNVRRTDYVSVSGTASVLGFVGLEYYRTAVELVQDVAGDLQFFVFSDDLTWCRENLDWLPNNPVFVDHSHAGRQFSHYLQLMSLAQLFIIPNSTFAWWAAWLSPSVEKFVVRPKRWFFDAAIDSSDLCPPDWNFV